MFVLPLDKMTVEEKLQAMEMVWEDLSRNAEDIPMPSWHKEFLEARERDIKEGRAKFIPWEEARRMIEEETNKKRES